MKRHSGNRLLLCSYIMKCVVYNTMAVLQHYSVEKWKVLLDKHTLMAYFSYEKHLVYH